MLSVVRDQHLIVDPRGLFDEMMVCNLIGARRDRIGSTR